MIEGLITVEMSLGIYFYSVTRGTATEKFFSIREKYMEIVDTVDIETKFPFYKLRRKFGKCGIILNIL